MRKLIYILFAVTLFACGEDAVEEVDDGFGPNDSGSNTNDNAPTSPSLVYPLNETECSNDNLTFEWNQSTDPLGNNITYKLYLSTSPNFNNNLEIYTTYNTHYNLGLPQSTALYWKVEATNGTDSSFSEARSLYTQGDGATNTIPLLEYLSPQNDVIISDDSVTLQWQGSDNETSNNSLAYKVYFSEIGNSLNLFESEFYGTQYFINGLQSGITYQWLIYVTDGDGATNVGNVWKFTVE